MTWFVEPVESLEHPSGSLIRAMGREGPFSGEVEAWRRARKLTKRNGKPYEAVDIVVGASRETAVPECGPFRGPKEPVTMVDDGETVEIKSANGDLSGAIILPRDVADNAYSGKVHYDVSSTYPEAMLHDSPKALEEPRETIYVRPNWDGSVSFLDSCQRTIVRIEKARFDTLMSKTNDGGRRRELDELIERSLRLHKQKIATGSSRTRALPGLLLVAAAAMGADLPPRRRGT